MFMKLTVVSCVYDDKNRTISETYSDGFSYERIYDDDWDMYIPAHVIEYEHGKKVYERHYNDEVYYK